MKTYLVQTIETRIEAQTQQINAKSKSEALIKAAKMYLCGNFVPNKHTKIKIKHGVLK